MNQREARKLAKKIEDQGCTAKLRGYVGSSVVSLVVTDHLTGYTCIIESPEEWAERERLVKLYSKVY